MKQKKSEVEVIKINSLKKATSSLNINGEKNEYIVFTEGNLPPHHHETVKEWLEKLITETLIFSEALQKKLKRMKQEKLFKEESFKLSDINHVLLQIYKAFDSSLENLTDFRKSIDDYISSWKVALDGNDLSDSSVEEVVALDEECVGEKQTEKETDIKSNSASHDETSKDSKDDNTTDKVLRLRVRKPSELNRLTTEELSNDCNSRSSGLNGLQNEEHKLSSSSDECIICDDDDDDGVKKPEKDSSEPVKKSHKLSLSVTKGKRKNVISSDSDSQLSKPESVSTKVADKASGTDDTAEAQGISQAKEVPKDDLGVDSASSSSDDCVLLSPDEANKSKSVKEEEEEEKTKNVTEGTINWDTSSSASTERDWIVRNKKSKQEEENSDKKKKKVLKKKERQQKKRNLLTSSDDDDNVSKLCDFKNLKRKKRNISASSSGSDDKEKVKKKKSSHKSNKKKEDKMSLMDCLNESGSNHSDSSDIDLNLECISNLKCLTNGQEGLNQEEFSVGLVESDDLAVLTDSSLDSIFDALVKKNVKVKRGPSNPKKEGEKKTKVHKRRRDKLLEAKLTDTDTTEGEERYQKSKMKTRIDSSESEEEEVKPLPPKNKQRTTKNSAKARKTLFSDSEASLSGSESSNDKDKSEEDEDKDKKDDDDSETEKKTENKKKRKRIQRHSDSSDEDGDPNTPSKSDGKGRRNIRKVLKEESLEKTTKEALKEEEERKRRIAEKQKLYNELLNKVTSEDVTKILDELVLDFDVETKEPLVSVDKDLVKKLKPHQAEGIKFMWDSCFESVKDAKEGKGSGCILAHCMGLGKTLQVITLVHTLLTCDKVDVNRVLVVCPFSTVQNWVNEFRKWLKDVGSGEDIEIYNMIKTAVNHRSYQLRDWERTGGVMVLGYNLFRTLVAPRSRMKASVKKAIEETLLDPGPDVVVCDEGHILKNEKTAIAKAMSKLKTRRRIVLTGTPLQNNLVEYHCMVQFVKPNLLGTRKEFQNRFVHPIQNGQFEDSTPHDVKIMKRRAHVLHKMLDGIVQRKDYGVLTPYLPPKYEYVIHVKLTEVQTKLYSHYLENFARKSKNEGGGLFQDFQHLLRICTHPRSLLIHSDKESLKREFVEDEESEGSLKDFIDDGSDSSESSSAESSVGSSGSGSDRSRSKTPPKRKNTRSTRASGNVSEEEEELPVKRTEWWASMVTDEELQDIKSSSKLFLFFTILKHCEEIGDKLLVFSQSLYTLDLIEHFLELVDENAHKKEEDQNPLLKEFNSNWDKGLDYFRLDGGTSSDCRANWCKVFNQASNTRGRLFLISTRAGGLGINLTGANRVIIFDASWNPSFDVQSIFRVYRFGQDKPCYIYRFLSKGTMEEKIYERQVAKLSTSLRVIDEQQIDRHFTQTSLAELYAFNPEPPETRETPILPKDRLMAELIQSYSDIILNHHQHDSLLENQEDEELNEEERKAAWLEFENEKNNVPPPNAFVNQGYPGFANPNQFALQANMILNNLVEKVRLQNPNLADEVVRKRAIDVLQGSPFWQQHQQNLVNNYVVQQQQQFFQQQQFLQQQQLLQAQQLHQQQLKQQALNTNTYPNLSNLLERNGTSTSENRPGKSVGGPSQPIEIDDE